MKTSLAAVLCASYQENGPFRFDMVEYFQLKNTPPLLIQNEISSVIDDLSQHQLHLFQVGELYAVATTYDFEDAEAVMISPVPSDTAGSKSINIVAQDIASKF